MMKIIIGDKKIVKKLDEETKLNKLREILNYSLPKNGYFILDDAIIEKNDESDYSIKNVVKNKQIICMLNTESIKVFLNDKNICKLDISIDEPVENLIKELNGKIPKNCRIKYENTEIPFEDAKNDSMTIKNLSSKNSIYFLGQESNEKGINNFENEMDNEI